jgi:hypothetical protein
VKKKIKNIIKSLIQEYGTGAGGRAPVKGGQNPRQAQRITFDDDSDEMDWYAGQNRYGAEGGQRIGDTPGPNYNTSKFPIYEKLKKFIKQHLEEMEIDEQAYGNATLTTQGQAKSKASIPTDEYPFTRSPKTRLPGVWEENLQEQNPRIAQLQKAIQDRTDDNQDDTLEIQKLGIEDAESAAAKANADQGPAISDAERKLSELVSNKKSLIRQKTKLVEELRRLNDTDTLELTPEQVERREALPGEIQGLEAKIEESEKGIEQAITSLDQMRSSRNQAAAAASTSVAQMRKEYEKAKRDMKKATPQQPVAESLYNEYMELRKNSNLMEYIDSYKREILFEGAMAKFFNLFDKGKSDEEILKLYAERGVIVPEQFIGKARKKHESLKRDKLDLEELETETKNFKKVPLIDEDEIEIDNKVLSTRLMNEAKKAKEKIKGKNKINIDTDEVEVLDDVDNVDGVTINIKEENRKFKIPQEIEYALTKTLKMNPLIRFVKNLKAVNSIPESYRVFLLNNQYFDIIYETFSLMVKIGTKEYFIGDIAEKNYAIKHINRLMTEPIIKTGEDEEDMEDMDMGGPPPKSPSAPPPPPLPPAPEPEEPEA